MAEEARTPLACKKPDHPLSLVAFFYIDQSNTSGFNIKQSCPSNPRDARDDLPRSPGA
jgi:hypothetical protein